MIELQRRGRYWFVLYAATILFIGSRREVRVVARWYAKLWKVRYRTIQPRRRDT